MVLYLFFSIIERAIQFHVSIVSNFPIMATMMISSSKKSNTLHITKKRMGRSSAWFTPAEAANRLIISVGKLLQQRQYTVQDVRSVKFAAFLKSYSGWENLAELPEISEQKVNCQYPSRQEWPPLRRDLPRRRGEGHLLLRLTVCKQLEQCLACEGWDRGNGRDAAMVFHSNDIQTHMSFPQRHSS